MASCEPCIKYGPPSRPPQAMGCYDLLEVLGKGNFATVRKAIHVFSGEEVAVKIIDKTRLDATGQTHLLQEVHCMRLVRHPNIVRLYEIIDTPNAMFLVLELADGGDLYDYMLKNEKAMSEKTARRYFTQVVRAVDYCHQLHVVHRDLKPENVLMFRKLRMVKITDFSFGHCCQPGTSLETSCGSMRYSSPEILCGDTYDGPAVDVWGLGILLYAMVCGRPPFMEMSDSETIAAIMDCRYPIPVSLTPSCTNLIGRMLVKKPELRATIPEILQHPWMQLGAAAFSPGSIRFGELEWDGSSYPHGCLQPAVCCPLVCRQHLSDDAHEEIIRTMLDGALADDPDEINHALAADEYNNITATYYLLAESLLRQIHPHDSALTSTEEVELLPVSARFTAEDLETDYRFHRPSGLSSRARNRPISGPSIGKRAVDLASVAEMLEELAEEEDENMEPTPAFDSVQPGKGTASPRYSPATSRRLVSTKSSPHLNLLNKIKEEVPVGHDADDFLDEAFFIPVDRVGDPNSLRNRERQLTSPDRLKRIDRARRTRSRSGSGSSQTSSDTSDNDDVGTSNGWQSASRLPFSRHRPHHHHRHRSASSCSHTHHTYSRESSENNPSNGGSAPMLFNMGEELDNAYFTKPKNPSSRKHPPFLQHSQSLIVIPCHQLPQTRFIDSAEKADKKRHVIHHRPQSLPPVPHSKLFHEMPMRKTVSTLNNSYVRQQC